MSNTVAFAVEGEDLILRGLSQTGSDSGRDNENNAGQKILVWITKTVCHRNMPSFLLHPYSSHENISWQGD
jgi:hypothetical protein